MAKQLQLRKGTATEHDTFTGANGEVTVDTTNKTLRVHDGSTVGGHPVAAKANTDGTISLIKKDGTSAGTINSGGLFNNTLTSTNTNQALTAAQGKVLKDTLDTTTSSTFGVGQTWQNVLDSRFAGVTYTNTTPKTITVFISIVHTADGYFYVNNEVFCNYRDGGSERTIICLPIPPNSNYRIQHTPETWWEMR